MQKREIIFVYLPNTSHFMHLQSVRQKKFNIHYKTNKYRWHFRSKPHQTTSLRKHILTVHHATLRSHALSIYYKIKSIFLAYSPIEECSIDIAVNK